jgi:F0F1-type ATP synthase membrane subunit a
VVSEAELKLDVGYNRGTATLMKRTVMTELNVSSVIGVAFEAVQSSFVREAVSIALAPILKTVPTWLPIVAGLTCFILISATIRFVWSSVVGVFHLLRATLKYGLALSVCVLVFAVLFGPAYRAWEYSLEWWRGPPPPPPPTIAEAIFNLDISLVVSLVLEKYR